MPGDNLEVARRAFADLRARRFEGGAWDPGVEVVNAEGWVIETAYHGRDGLRRWWEDLAEAFGEFEIQLEDVVEVDGQRVLTTQRFAGSFRTTDIPFDAPWASILTIRAGRVVHAQGFLTKRRAMRAAGLEAT
jgi:ketosteroid isomerase-like protein